MRGWLDGWADRKKGAIKGVMPGGWKKNAVPDLRVLINYHFTRMSTLLLLLLKFIAV